MITGLRIRQQATYDIDGASMDGLKKINFIYGSNGTGKTTISRLIATPDVFANCNINWEGGTPMKCFVYNRDFVSENFRDDNQLKGIFTLGEDDADLEELIDKAKEEARELQGKIRNLNIQLEGKDGESGKRGDFKELEKAFREACWEYKIQYGETFKSALRGTLNDKVKFAERLRAEAQDKTAELRTKEYLEERAKSVFQDDVEKFDLLPSVDPGKLLETEQNELLSKIIIGKGDVDIAAMIQKLGNSDWVRAGREYYDDNEGVCPFCQQPTEDKLREDLNEFFDDAYTRDVDAINDLGTVYWSRAEFIAQKCEKIIESNNPYLDHQAFKAQYALFTEKANANTAMLSKKASQPSTPVQLNTLTDVLNEICTLIHNANEKTEEHNQLVENRGREQKTLKREVWRFIVNEAQAHINAHNEKTSKIEGAIASLTEALENAGRQLREKVAERQELEARVTSVKPTVDAINSILSSFGFQGFKLAEADKTGFYKIVRANGVDANRSLSEGEKTFITFLYFYQLLQGSLTESDVKTDRIAVFDDPISSLDSEILFIVSTLIRNIISQVFDDGLTKQVFVLTHNVYFHKEVAYNQDKATSYWLVSKRDNISRIKKAENGNPVKTAYEMLWLELEEENLRPLTVRNTLRRILEYYFKTIGGISFDDIEKKIPSDELLVYRSLISWVQDGSHCFDDDINVISTDESVDHYLTVFEKIFKETGHEGHFKMMKEKAYKSAQRHWKGEAAE